VLTAEVVVCTEFDASVDVRGKILVVHHIDPGWTLLFTQAAGIVAERGNALSHAAIIAREIGIPAVVAAVGATTILNTGDIITIDGTLGSITRESH
jgi:pyruvate,water dikinase